MCVAVRPILREIGRCEIEKFHLSFKVLFRRMEEEEEVVMATVRRSDNDDYFGQKLSDISVVAFEARQHCDVRIVSSEGRTLSAHQVRFLKLSLVFHFTYMSGKTKALIFLGGLEQKSRFERVNGT